MTTTPTYTEQRLIAAAAHVVSEARAGRRVGEAIDRLSAVLDALGPPEPKPQCAADVRLPSCKGCGAWLRCERCKRPVASTTDQQRALARDADTIACVSCGAVVERAAFDTHPCR